MLGAPVVATADADDKLLFSDQDLHKIVSKQSLTSNLLPAIAAQVSAAASLYHQHAWLQVRQFVHSQSC